MAVAPPARSLPPAVGRCSALGRVREWGPGGCAGASPRLPGCLPSAGGNGEVAVLCPHPVL